MLDILNLIIAVIASFIIGMAVHSTWVHGRSLCSDCTERSRCVLWCDTNYCEFYHKEGIRG